MKIIQINTVYGTGSTGKIVKDIHLSLLAAGHNSQVAYGRGDLSEDPNVTKLTRSYEVYADALAVRVTGLNGYFAGAGTKRLLALLEKLSPDIVHLHNIHGYYLNDCELLRYLGRSGYRTICTLHDEYMYTGKCGFAYGCTKWQSRCEKCPELHTYPESWMFDFTERMHARKESAVSEIKNLRLVVPSEWLKERVRKSFLASFPVTVIHNGVDADLVFRKRDVRELRSSLNLKSGSLVLAMAPDIMLDRKGGKVVLELAKRFLTEDVTFLLVGAKDCQSGAAANVRLLPPVKNSDIVAQFYSLADVFLLCSKSETFSMTCAEALCCGTRVVGFESGAPESVFRQPYAEFVPQGNLDALERELRVALSKDRDSSAVAAYGRDNFSTNRMCAAYADMFQEHG